MATYYWVGGSGTWDSSSSARWSATSGGAGGAGVPNETDFVIFNSASSGASYTVQVSINASCARITATAPATGNITFSNTVANDGYFMNCGTQIGSPVSTTSINIYNGAIFTPGATNSYMIIFMYVYASGTSTVTFNSSGAATQPILFAIFQGSNGAYANTLNFCNSTTQTFSSVSVAVVDGSGFVATPTYNTFNCTAATISIIGGIDGMEYFGFGSGLALASQNPSSVTPYQYSGNVNITNTSITIGAASTLGTAAFGGQFYMNAAVTACGTFSCGGASISILRPPTSNVFGSRPYFYISPLYTCSTQLANVTLSNGFTYTSVYYSSFGNVPGLSGNLVVSNTVSNPGGFYLAVIIEVAGSTFTIAGTTTITSASLSLRQTSTALTVTHTGAVSLVGSALGMSSYGGNVYNTSVVFSSTLSSTNPTSYASALHAFDLLYSAITAVGNVSLVDTYIVAYTATTTGASNTWTHGTVNGFAGNGAQFFRATFTKGLTTLTNATYNLVEDTSTQQFAALTLNGSIISCTAQYGGSNSISTTGNVILGSYSTTTLSTIRLLSSGSISITGSLTSTNAGSVASVHTITTNSGNLSVSSTTSLVDTVVNITGTTNAVQWTQTKTALGTTTGSNVFGGNATFTGNTAFTNSDVVFLGQTNSVTGTFSFTVTSAAVVVSTGSYATNDNPAITFVYSGASTLSVSSSFTITGATTNRTNVRTFVPYINSAPLDLRYGQVTISVASVSLSYVNFQNVTASGATPWTGTALGNATGNNNITFAAATSRFLVASSGTVQSNTAIWATSSGGATSINNYPLPQDTIAVDNNSASVGAVVVNFASIVYATNVIGQASINRSVTFSRSDRSSLVLLGNITLLTPTAGGLLFNLLNVTLANASSASLQTLSWPTGYAPIATSNTVRLYTYSLGSMTLSGSTSSSAYLSVIENANATPISGSYGTFTINDGVEVYANVVQIANTTANSNNFTSSIIYTTAFVVPQVVSTTAYTLGGSYAVFGGAALTTVTSNYVGNLNLAPTSFTNTYVNVPSIGNLNILYSDAGGGQAYMYFASCTVKNMTGGAVFTPPSGYVALFLYALSPGPATITKTGGGFVQLDLLYIDTLNAAPANTFYATNSVLIGPATGWTLSAAPGGAAGGNFFLEF